MLFKKNKCPLCGSDIQIKEIKCSCGYLIDQYDCDIEIININDILLIKDRKHAFRLLLLVVNILPVLWFSVHITQNKWSGLEGLIIIYYWIVLFIVLIVNIINMIFAFKSIGWARIIGPSVFSHFFAFITILIMHICQNDHDRHAAKYYNSDVLGYFILQAIGVAVGIIICVIICPKKSALDEIDAMP